SMASAPRARCSSTRPIAPRLSSASGEPCRLARDIRDIGFRTADQIAAKLGIEKAAQIRAHREHLEEIRSMELTFGRLKAALIAGKIPVTDEALAILRAGLDTIRHGYRLNKVLRGIKTETEVKKDLSRLYSAC